MSKELYITYTHPYIQQYTKNRIFIQEIQTSVIQKDSGLKAIIMQPMHHIHPFTHRCQGKPPCKEPTCTSGAIWGLAQGHFDTDSGGTRVRTGNLAVTSRSLRSLWSLYPEPLPPIAHSAPPSGAL